MLQRMIRAARLDKKLYRAVAAQKGEMTEAILVILLVALATGIGTGSAGIFSRDFGHGVEGLVSGIISVFVSWVLWSYVTFAVGKYAFEVDTTPGAVMRSIGFAQSPAVLNIFGGLPIIGPWISGIALLWSLVASFVATREVLRLDDTRTLVAVVTGFIVVLMIAVLLYTVFGPAASLFGGIGR